MDTGVIAVGFAVVVFGGAAAVVSGMLKSAAEKRERAALVNRRCEKCGHYVQSERSRLNGDIEGVMGRERQIDKRGRTRLVPKVFTFCDRCAQDRQRAT